MAVFIILGLKHDDLNFLSLPPQQWKSIPGVRIIMKELKIIKFTQKRKSDVIIL